MVQLGLVLSSALVLTASAKSRIPEDYPLYQRFSTAHGELTFVDQKGSYASSAVDAKLDGTAILTSRNSKDGWDSSESLMMTEADSMQMSKNFKPGMMPLPIDRLIVAEGRNGTCINQFVILDFTGSKPFVSERFGYNPKGKYCLKFARAKWGKKESYIYLDGPQKFIYYTGGKVIGPIE